MIPTDPIFIVGVFLVALLYSSVGHGGASGYLALMAFSTVAAKQASTLALVMNLFVAGVSFALYQRAKYFDWKLTWPFLLGSVPLAFVGGLLKLHDSWHNAILAVALAGAAFWLIVGVRKDVDKAVAPRLGVQLATGGGIGLLSGMVGVGGGIFLSPVVILARWADAKKTASLAAVFILANSFAGLLARSGSVAPLVQQYWFLILAGCLGALAGGSFGAFWLPSPVVRRSLGVALLVATFKLVWKS